MRTHPHPSPGRPNARGLTIAFLDESRRRLRDEYLPKIRRAVRILGPDDLWWRPNARSNSVGNLLLHLEGNIRQWILYGIAGRPGLRDRDSEFEARQGPSGPTLVRRLQRTIEASDTVLADLGPRDLCTQHEIQGYPVTVLEAVYHVVEHCSGHTGQILYISKLRRGRDLALYPKLSRRRRKPTGPGRFL